MIAISSGTSGCPTQFQLFIPGVDYRVHVVRERVIATGIESDVDDYRYAGGSPPVLAACDVDDRLIFDDEPSG